MSQELDQLKQLAEKLPKEVKAHAVALVDKMSQVVEGIGDSPLEWRPDMLRVFQPSSDRSKLPKGAQIGSIILGETVMDQPLKVIPLRLWNARQYWSPDKDEARMICSSPDAVFGWIGKYCKECEFSVFNTEANRSECNKVKTVITICSDLSRIFVINFAKTNYTFGMDWEKLMKKAGVAPYKRIYEIKTETSKKHKNVESTLVETKNESTPVAYLEFLEALFSKVGVDREEHKKNFYEIVKARTPESGLERLPAPTEGSEETVLPAIAETTTQQTDLAKKYTM